VHVSSLTNREVKHDVYGKRQTAVMKLLPSLSFNRVYSRMKLFVFAMKRRRRYSIFDRFIYGLEEKNSQSEVIFAVCRLPSAVCRLPSAVCRLPSAVCRLPSAVCRLPSAVCRLPLTSCLTSLSSLMHQ